MVTGEKIKASCHKLVWFLQCSFGFTCASQSSKHKNNPTNNHKKFETSEIESLGGKINMKKEMKSKKIEV